MVLGKGFLWTSYMCLTGIVLAGTAVTWDWLAYGRLALDHPSSANDAEIAKALGQMQQAEEETTPVHTPLDFDKIAAGIKVRPLPKPDPIAKVAICFRSGKLQGVDCWLVDKLPVTPFTPDATCRECLY